MSKTATSLLTLEEQLASVEADALAEEQQNATQNYAFLQTEHDHVLIPFPDVGPYDTAHDYDDISALQYKKGQNQPGWDEQARLRHYLDNDRLHSGHIRTNNGHDYYFVDSPDCPSKTLSAPGPVIRLVNTDDPNFADILHRWRYPRQHADAVFSRNITMSDRVVRAVDIILDRSSQMLGGITDAYLRKALLRSKGQTGVQSIIQTIQEKQDAIRLLPAHKSFVVQGCAGSGKTMVLLHRLRYLLFNKAFAQGDYYFLAPSNNYRRFIQDVCSRFRISYTNVVPVQTYYQLMMGHRPKDDAQDISELVFPAAYLKRVYSAEFMRECYRRLFSMFAEQANALIDLCDERLGELVESERLRLENSLQQTRTNAVSYFNNTAAPILPFLTATVTDYESISAAHSEINEAYQTAKVQYDAAAAPSVDIVISPDDERFQRYPYLMQLRKDVEAERIRVQKASFFTAASHRKKLQLLETQYAAEYQETERLLVEEDRRAHAERAARLQFLYDGVTLDAAAGILEDLQRMMEAAERHLTQTKAALENLESHMQEKYQQMSDLLNELVVATAAIPQESNSYITALEPSIGYFSQRIPSYTRLVLMFRQQMRGKDDERQLNQFRLFTDRTDAQLQAYLNTLLFNTCKSAIKREFDLQICNLYKHYWYLALQCQYLTRREVGQARPFIFIDEAQDLSLTELDLIRKLNTWIEDAREFPTLHTPTLNVFGDVNQVITEHGIQTWDALSFIDERFTLDENFRNTNQIVAFCNRTLPFSMQPVGVDMEEVQVFSMLGSALGKKAIPASGAVFIVKDEYAVADLQHLLESSNVTNHTIYTVKTVKGLEFRNVCVFDRDMSPHELYIAYTRALAQLTVVHDLPHYTSLDKQLYEQGPDEAQDE